MDHPAFVEGHFDTGFIAITLRALNPWTRPYQPGRQRAPLRIKIPILQIKIPIRWH